MGQKLHSMSYSAELEDLIRDVKKLDGHWDTVYQSVLADACDMTSTDGYDNDESTGPELLDNGVALAYASLEYDAKAIIFHASDDEGTRYYAFGKDENDAVRRVRAGCPIANIRLIRAITDELVADLEAEEED